MIAIGSDHAGFELKEDIKKHFDKRFVFKDYGTFSKEPYDFPESVEKVTESVLEGESEVGILICGTGIGITIAANRKQGIRAALCSNSFSARTSRTDNNANILTIGSEVIGKSLALEIVETFLTTDFSHKERYVRRLNMID